MASALVDVAQDGTARLLRLNERGRTSCGSDGMEVDVDTRSLIDEVLCGDLEELFNRLEWKIDFGFDLIGD